MGIDAQRSGTSELRDRAVEVRRGRTAYPRPSGCPGTSWYARREFWAGQLAEKVHSSAQHDEGDPVWIVEEEQRKRSPCALRVAAARGHLPCLRAATMHIDNPPRPPPYTC